MKIITYISGFLILILLVMVLMGMVDYGGDIKGYIAEGNRLYEQKDYEGAFLVYKEGLEKSPEHAALNYNLGKTSYLLESYAQAAAYFIKADDRPDKYIGLGNSNLKLGDSTQEPAQKKGYYQKALDAYKKGILMFPENIPLKYNYEYVRKKLDDEKQESDQDEGQADENQESDQDEGQDGKNQESDQDEGQDDKNQESDRDEGQDDENQKSDQDEGQDDEKQEGHEDEEQAEQIDSELLEQVLRMLEEQEKESLKNNREVRDSGKEDEYDW